MILNEREFGAVLGALAYMREAAWTDDKTVYTLATGEHAFPPLTNAEIASLMERLAEANVAEITVGEAPVELTAAEAAFLVPPKRKHRNRK